MYYIYELTSPSGAVYIGQANDIKRRWKAYRLKDTKVKKQPALWNALNKYPNFRDWTTRVLYTYQTKQAVDIAEKILIKLNKMKGVHSYNIAAGGDGGGSGVDSHNYDRSHKYGANACEDITSYRKGYYEAHKESILSRQKARYDKEKKKAVTKELSLIRKANNLTEREWRALPKERRVHLKEAFRNGISG